MYVLPRHMSNVFLFYSFYFLLDISNGICYGVMRISSGKWEEGAGMFMYPLILRKKKYLKIFKDFACK